MSSLEDLIRKQREKGSSLAPQSPSPTQLRNDRMSPPPFAMGQQSPTSLQSSGSGLFNPPPVGGSTGFTGLSPHSSFNQQPMGAQKSTEDKFFDAMSVGAKGTYGFFKDFGSCLKLTDVVFWARCAAVGFRVGAGVGIFGLILSILGIRLLPLFIAGLIVTVVGVATLVALDKKQKEFKAKLGDDGILYDDYLAKKWGLIEDIPEPEMVEPSSNFDFDSSPVVDEDSEDFWDDTDEDEEDDIWDDDDDGDTLDEVPVVLAKDTTEVLSSIDIPEGMYSRQFLYEKYIAVLGGLMPNFAQEKILSEESDTFYEYVDVNEQVVDLLDLDNYDDMSSEPPQVIEVKRKAIMDIVILSRGKKVNINKYQEEFEKIVAADDGIIDPNIYTSIQTVGTKIYITVFRPTNISVSVRDGMEQVKDFFLNPKNEYPVVLGFDRYGKVHYMDMKNVESMLIAGMPRSGKSWFAKGVFSQLVAFNSPRDLAFYIGDIKGATSDFNEFKVPHVKRFESKPELIVGMLRDLVKIEGNRRKKVIGDAGYLKIWDYKKANPDADMPLLYVVIDEMIALSAELDKHKELKDEFMGYLVTIITAFPNLGIRFIGLPHILKDNIIKKTASDSISCKISVLGDPEHIEKTTGTKPRDYDFKLTNVGDMAIKMNSLSPSLLYSHSFILGSSDDEISRILDFQKKFWERLEPSMSKGASKNEDVLAKANDKFGNLSQEAEDELLGLANSDDVVDIFSDSEDMFSNNIF